MIVGEQRLAKAQTFLGRLKRLPIRPRIVGEPRLCLFQFRSKGSVAKARG